MRLERLEIDGFGRLRGLSVGFAPGLTVILGGNETGKSTVHRAVRCALYGLDAGGQGRAVDRSEWSRWRPWTAGPYGVVLTYQLEDGSRFRVARRLDQREQTVQVQELGGRDVTAAMRVGRLVAPGQVHLGIDESVFCATAWLGDDGLRPGSPEAPGQRVVAGRLQEAIERLADTGSGVTAATAVRRLREAMARIGSERRSATPLGVATSRMRQLDYEIEAARRRAESLADDQERLVRVEAEAAAATERRVACERAWLLGRLARIGQERAELATARSEAEALASTIEAEARCRNFPLEDEGRVVALGGELHQAMAESAASAARAAAAEGPLELASRRRAEIADGLGALGEPISLADPALAEVPVLERELAAESGVARRLEEIRRAEAGREQLRRQVAATGLGGIQPADVERLLPLFERALRPATRPLLRLAALAAAAGVSATAAARAAGLGLPAVLSAAIGLLCAGGLVLAHALVGDEAGRARRQLGRLCPGLDVSPGGLDIAASRLPTLGRLQDELLRFEALIEAERRELEAARGRLAALALRCTSVVDRLQLPRPPDPSAVSPNSIDEFGTRAADALRAVHHAIEWRHRWDDLREEDARLAREEATLVLQVEDAAKRLALVDDIEGRLRGIFRAAGLEAAAGPQAVEAFREACEGRRRHDAAVGRLAEVERRIAAVGSDEPTLARRAEDFGRELRARGVDPGAISSAPPLDSARLDLLEKEVDRARRAAEAASTEAAALRARLSGAGETMPRVAELADERASCAAARERGLRQLAALERAVELVESVTRHVHRSLAPRLADSVGQRLSMLTDGRYRMVNVDTGHFEVSLMSDDRCELVPLELVSRGTRDQVSLLLRLALSELLGDRGEPVPLLLDEPLISADPGRAEHAIEFLSRLSESHQVVLATSDAALAGRFEGALGGACRVVALEPLPATVPADGLRATAS